MKQLPEVIVGFNWIRAVNYILLKLEPSNEVILKSHNSRMSKMFLNSAVTVLCEERGFYKKVKEWKDGDEIKVHLIRIEVAGE